MSFGRSSNPSIADILEQTVDEKDSGEVNLAEVISIEKAKLIRLRQKLKTLGEACSVLLPEVKEYRDIAEEFVFNAKKLSGEINGSIQQGKSK